MLAGARSAAPSTAVGRGENRVNFWSHSTSNSKKDAQNDGAIHFAGKFDIILEKDGILIASGHHALLSTCTG